MLPKIVAGFSEERKFFLESRLLEENFVLAIDASETNLVEFREWIVFCQNVVDSEGKYSMVIWNADKLSVECQGVLLKPLEEKKPMTKIYLLVEKEASLLPTILSRCEIETFKSGSKKEIYWKDLVKGWKNSPGEILDYCERFEVEELGELLNEVIKKVKEELKNEVNKKRLKVVEIALETWQDIYQTNVNKRMALESFLLRSWRAIKTHQQQAV